MLVLTWLGGDACDGVLPTPRPGAVGLTLRWVAWPLQDLADLQDVLRRIGELDDDVRARGEPGQEELEGDALAEGRGVPAHGVARGSAIRCRFGMLAVLGAACFTRLPSSGSAQQRNPT